MQITTLEQMKALTEHALKAVKLGDTEVTLKEDHVSLANGLITIEQCEIQEEPPFYAGWVRDSKGQVRRWEVLRWVYTPGGTPRWDDPPDAIFTSLYRGANPFDAVYAAVMALHKDNLTNAMELYSTSMELDEQPG